MLKLNVLLLCFLPVSLIAQTTITGKVYDYKSTAKNIGVFNLTSYNYTYTNQDGDFSIEAAVNDTILFSSEFYKPQRLVVKDKHFNTTNVIELDILVNALGTVKLSNTSKFNTDKYKENLDTQLQNDIKNRPHLYAHQNTRGDLKLLIKAIIDVFKSKKSKETPIQAINYKQLYTLFNSNAFFNKKLLTNDLNIEDKYIPLFFDYCDTKQLKDDLLKERNRIILLDSLVKFSKEFTTLIKDTEPHLTTD